MNKRWRRSRLTTRCMRPKVTAWKMELLGSAAAIVGGEVLAANGKARIQELKAKIGQLTIENNFSENAVEKYPGPSAKR